MPDSFRLSILAADKAFYNGESLSLVIPTTEGSYGVMAHHMNMIRSEVGCHGRHRKSRKQLGFGAGGFTGAPGRNRADPRRTRITGGESGVTKKEQRSGTFSCGCKTCAGFEQDPRQRIYRQTIALKVIKF